GISMLVMLDGRIVFEHYPNGGRPDRAHELASGTKSFSGILAAAAAQDGLLTLDEKVSDTLREWRDDPKKSQITIRQLLSLTSGLETGGERGAVPTYAEAVAKPVVTEPGTRFKYGAVAFQVFGEVMRRKLEANPRGEASPQNESPVDYLKRRVYAPIGLEIGGWRLGADGNPTMPSGAQLTARNWAKFGELVRLEGAWEGKAIVEAKLLDQCFEGSKANPAYGLTWWLHRPTTPAQRLLIPQLTLATDLYRGSALLPDDLVMAAGAGNQRLYVSRKLGLVVVRQADGIMASLAGARSGFSDAEFLLRLLKGTDLAGNAVEPGQLEPSGALGGLGGELKLLQKQFDRDGDGRLDADERQQMFDFIRERKRK
ncbi:MAG: serine hydrolase domain-containing protein, partial [Planctomycetota bacterium]